jgi:hypothetical protein
MSARSLLHKSRVDEFLNWCRDVKGHQVRPGRGPYQIAQIKPKWSKQWHVLYSRNYMPEHVTVVVDLVPLVTNFIRTVPVKIVDPKATNND